MPKGVPAGQAYFTLSLNDRVTKKIGSVGQRIKTMTQRISTASTRIAKAAAASFAVVGSAAVGAAAAVVKLGRAFANYGDQFGKMATRTGIGAEALQELSYAAQTSGTNIDQLSQALFRARRRIGNAALGTGPAVRALDKLGLTATSLSRMRPEQQFEKLVDALAKVGNESQRNQLAFELFGDNFREIQPLIAQGVGGIRALRQEARNMGIVLSDEDIRRAEQLQDAFFRVGQQFKIAIAKLGAFFGPGLLRELNRIESAMGAISQAFTRFIKTSEIGWIKFELFAMRSLRNVIRPMQLLSSQLPWIGTAIGQLNLDVGLRAAQQRLSRLELAFQFGGGDAANTFDWQNQRTPLDNIPTPVASTQLLSGFAASMASTLSFNKGDPKREEKQMVELLQEINDNGLIVGAGAGGQ